jgi:hypothetical protein
VSIAIEYRDPAAGWSNRMVTRPLLVDSASAPDGVVVGTRQVDPRQRAQLVVMPPCACASDDRTNVSESAADWSRRASARLDATLRLTAASTFPAAPVSPQAIVSLPSERRAISPSASLPDCSSSSVLAKPLC